MSKINRGWSLFATLVLCFKVTAAPFTELPFLAEALLVAPLVEEAQKDFAHRQARSAEVSGEVSLRFVDGERSRLLEKLNSLPRTGRFRMNQLSTKLQDSVERFETLHAQDFANRPEMVGELKELDSQLAEQYETLVLQVAANGPSVGDIFRAGGSDTWKFIRKRRLLLLGGAAALIPKSTDEAQLLVAEFLFFLQPSHVAEWAQEQPFIAGTVVLGVASAAYFSQRQVRRTLAQWKSDGQLPSQVRHRARWDEMRAPAAYSMICAQRLETLAH